MNTEIAKSSGIGVGEPALVMAVGIVMDRISRLSEPDRADLYELMKGLREVRDSEEFESIRTAMTEILDQEPVKAVRVKSESSESRSEKLKKWIDFISNRIRDLRSSHGLTQAQLAERTGLPQSHISRLEQGEHSPSRATLEKIAKAFDIPIGHLDPSA